jgi:thioredoxin 1
MSNAIAVTDTNFADEIEKHEGLAVVDFWATWCGPCRMVAPILDQLAVEYAGRAKVTKLDVDANQQTAIRFNVRSIPTILFFKDGKLVDQVVGAVPKPALESKFKLHAAFGATAPAPVAQQG